MYNILVVEDTAVVRKILAKLIGANPFFRCVMCKDLATAREAMKQDVAFLAAVVDLNLPDAPNGEVVNEVLEKGIPTVVLTGNFSETLRGRLLAEGVLDYITKDCRFAYNQVVKVLDRLRKNTQTKVLVVDDSSVSRNIICNLLTKAKFEVESVNDGLEALQKLKENPDIKLVISDHHMPNMDGCELVKALREQPCYQNLVFIGVSSEGDGLMSAKFIKGGANDFLKKPFHHEEFYWRVFSSLDSMEMLETIQLAAKLDSLTGLFNRGYLFEQGEELFAKRDSLECLSVCMFDLDEFKQVNDSLGHRIGDELIVQFAKLLQESFSSDVVGRYGGEEFAVISARPERVMRLSIQQFMKSVRCMLFTEKRLAVTCSIGICMSPKDGLMAAFESADLQLYRAKNGGRNRIEPFDSEVA
ncbi:diguanylate cyclase [Marinomonas gallaica]|uniref:diguanylate cyclase n=1 Tax=Marinomonas gallaica TaxID=1806667 RepID=UPI003A90BF91